MEKKDLVISIIDVETTGTHPDRDQIIEFAVQKGLRNPSFERAWRIKPSVPVSPGAQAVHGISNEDLADCLPFQSLASTIRKIIDGSDMLVGYNLNFDIDMLQHEFQRIREKPLELSKKLLIDPLRLWRQCEPRTLSDAVERFAGKKHSGAHAALDDVQATGHVLLGMMKQFGLEGMNWGELETFLNPDRQDWIGPSHHIRWQEGAPAIGFGKHSGVALIELMEKDESYLRWMAEKDFPAHVRVILGAVREKSQAEFVNWIKETYGPPPSER